MVKKRQSSAVERACALLNSKLGEVGLADHVSQALDEVRQLALDLHARVDQTGIPVPAIRKVLEQDQEA